MDAGSGALVAACVLIASAAFGEYRTIAVPNGGGVAGHVRVVGEVPTLPPQVVDKQHAQCGETVKDERVLVGAGGALRNVVVTLNDVTAGKAVARDQPVRLDNTKCTFVPHVLSASLGQTLEIRNTDTFLHDAHAWLGTRTLFNVALPKGRTVRKPLEDAGLVQINCNVHHAWMHAYLYVAEHPYHAVTGADGGFSIDGIPPGTYTVHVWHELLGSADRQVTVESGKTTALDLELRAGAAP